MGRVFQRVSPVATEPIDGDTNIFTQFDNPELKCAIVNWAVSHDCTVTPGTGANIIMDIYFIGVVDRAVLEKACWDSYLQFACIAMEEAKNPDPSAKTREGLFARFKQGGREELNGIAPLIILDSNPEFSEPPGVPFLHCDPDDHEKIIAIIERYFELMNSPSEDD